jgi:hypothetical protein
MFMHSATELANFINGYGAWVRDQMDLYRLGPIEQYYAKHHVQER